MKKKLAQLVRSRAAVLFALVVVLPTLVAAVYYGTIASPVYVSESQLVVRSPDRVSPSPIGTILQSAGFSRAQDDSYTVQEFILSRDALRALDTQLDIKDRYSNPEHDVFSRFAGLDPDDSFEAFHKYYRKHVAVGHDPASSILTVQVRAFEPTLAASINAKLLEMSEGLVNRLNERGRGDLVTTARLELADAEQKARQANVALNQFRNSQNVIDPERQATFQLQQVAKLNDELLAAKISLSQLQAVASDNSQVALLKDRVAILESAIAKQVGTATGSGASLSSKATDYQRLALDREFADRQLAAAMSALENARNETRRKQVYLERISTPSVPDAPTEPRFLKMTASTFLLGLVLWGILSMFIASVKEHNA